MKPASLYFLALILLCGVGFGLAQQPTVRPLSLREALRLAKSNNYQILVARSQLREAGGQNLESWKGFLPRLTFGGGYIQSDDPVTVFGTKLKQGVFTQNDFDLRELNKPDAIENWSTSIQVQQPLINVDAIFGKSAAGLAKKASRYRLARAVETVYLEVERTYYGLILSHSNLRTIDDAVESAETRHREVEAAYKKGLVSEADLLASQVRLAEMQEQQLTGRLQIANASDHLKFLLGIEDVAEIIPTDSLSITEEELRVRELPPDTIPTNRSDLVALELREKAAHRGALMRRSEWIPRLNAFGGAEWNSDRAFDTGNSNWTVGVQLEWRILDGFGTMGRVQQANAISAAARAEFKEAQARSNMEVRRACRALLTAKERMRVAEKAVAQSSESLRIVEARFQEGLEKVSDLLDREAAHTSAQLRLQKAKHDVKVAYSELQFYLGAESEPIDQ
ncbi:MAG: TolC family protein [Candidatus Latescibacterota bacterium]|nr:MAG: TolC family protein [Candidatus Latescibacterota bacterium]